jgi:iron complex outermembrane receptor protein
MRKYFFDIYAGANNILNQEYSLGNDINAINGRYYNTAPLLNYYAGISLCYLK